MIAAFATSSVFLVSYLYYHAHVGSVHFPGQGWVRPVYFTILISHTMLAAAVVPLVVMSLTYGLKSRFDRHRRISRWTFPVWLYVSVTGVIVYIMLYQIYGGTHELLRMPRCVFCGRFMKSRPTGIFTNIRKGKSLLWQRA